MRITKQSSGGRGEYEVAEYAPNGLQPSDLLGRVLHLRLGGHVIDTRVELTHEQGKYRLRLVDRNESSYPHAHLQVAHALLMPSPRREEQKTTGGEPVLQTDSYIVKNINFGDVADNPDGGMFLAEVLTVDAANLTITAEQIPVLQRMAAVETAWGGRSRLPASVAALLEQHEGYVRAGGPIPKTVRSLIAQLQEQVEAYSAEIGVAYTRTTDVVPALLAILGDVIQEVPVPLDQIEPDQIEVRRRETKRWQQWVARRGPASVRFRQKVRAAYNSRCVMCGNRFPPSSYNAAGVDAAHILPWATYDLDEIPNGVALCKLHHWAFDEKLLLIVYEGGTYYVRLSPDAESALAGVDFSLDTLRAVEGPVTAERLPAHFSEWPSPNFLARWQSEGA